MAITRPQRTIGLPPGTATYLGTNLDRPVKIHYVAYNKDLYTEESFDDANAITIHDSELGITQWYDVRGLHNVNLIKSIAEKFDMHPIAVEDTVDIHQRPTFVEHDSGIFLSFNFLYVAPNRVIRKELVSLYFGKGFVLSFQEKGEDLFAVVRHRIASASGRIRTRGADYLAYALTDIIFDHYYTVLDVISDEIDKADESMLLDQSKIERAKIYQLKRKTIRFRKDVLPSKDAVHSFQRSENPLIDKNTHVFLKDLLDHATQIIEYNESLREKINSIQEIYHIEVSTRMNQVMQYLTVVTTLFVPITFLAGIYGMNFQHMPELGYRHGYFILLGVMALIIVGILYFFKKKKFI